MTNNNVELKKQNKSSILGGLSIAVAAVLAALVINFFTDIIPLKELEGLPLFMPIPLAPIGAVLGFVGYRAFRDKLSLWGIISNIILFLVPVLYLNIGTAIEALLNK